VFVFFVFGLGFLVEFVIGALGEFLAVGFVFFCNRRLFFKWISILIPVGGLIAVGFRF
jgi:hypothetical protein